MPTFTGTADFKALANCSIINGSAVPGYFNFATDDTGTGIADWTAVNTAGATVDVTTNPGYLTIIDSTTSHQPYNADDCPGVRIPQTGDFDVEIRVAAPDPLTQRGGMLSLEYRVDATHRVLITSWIKLDGSQYGFTLYYHDETLTIYDDATFVGNTVDTPIRLRLVRSGNVFSGRYSLDDGATYVALNDATVALGTVGTIGIHYGESNAAVSDAIQFDYAEWHSGFGATSSVRVGTANNDSGSSNIGWNAATYAATLSDLEVIDSLSAQFVSATGDAESLTSYTPAEFVALGAQDYQYMRLQAYWTGAGSADTLDAISIETYMIDESAPSTPSATSWTHTDGAAQNITAEIQAGTEVGSAGYARTAVEVYNTATDLWYTRLADGTWEAYADQSQALLYDYDGDGDGQLFAVAINNLSANVTLVRPRSYDLADNDALGSAVAVSSIVTDLPALSSILASDTLDGEAGTLALSNVLVAGGGTFDEAARNTDPGVANVVLNTVYKIQNTTLTGEYVIPSSSPTAPTLAGGTPGDGQVTLSVALNANGDPAYIIYGPRAEPQTWSSPSESFKATSSGTVTVTGLVNLVEYQFAAVSLSDGLYGMPSSVVHATPRTDQQAAGVRQRDSVAASALRIAKRQGIEVTYYATKDATTGGIAIWGVPDQGTITTFLNHGGETDLEEFEMDIPRQTGFPPSGGIGNGAQIVFGGYRYDIEGGTADRGVLSLSASYRVQLRRYRQLSVEA